ncbi:MAG: GNAT family N-acetyltransferase [Calditrichia bacterium]
MNVRKATDQDIPTIVRFNAAMAQETEQLILNQEILTNGVLRLFRQPEYGFYIVAESGGEVVGCLMITYEWSDWRNGLFWWIQSVYVKPEWRRKKVYSSMINKIKEMAGEDKDVIGFRLYVDKDNKVAQQTYRNQGMSPCHYLMFEELL